MSDKLKSGISVRTTFVNGEGLPATKLNSLSAQLQNATQQLEKALGDIHTESHPYSTESDTYLSSEYGKNLTLNTALTDTRTRALDIVNIGRLIGPAANLNPHYQTEFTCTEDVPVGVHEFCLRYVPKIPSNAIFSDATVFGTFINTITDLAIDGDYHVDELGRVFCVLESNGGTVEYENDPVSLSGANAYQGASFNVIPDPNQLEAGGNGCSLSALDGDGARIITLPVISHHHYNIDGTSITLSTDDAINGLQLTLPEVLSVLSAGDVIPEGFVYLKNYTTDEIYKSATYIYDSQTTLKIKNVDLTSAILAGDKFYLITVGCDITTSIDDLRRKSEHTHDRSFNEPLISIEDIAGRYKDAGASGIFMPSEIPGNFFPQYLHRDGSTTGIDTGLNDQNVMRGDLVIGANGSAAGEYIAAAGSKSLKFLGHGNFTDSTDIYSTSLGILIIDPFGGRVQVNGEVDAQDGIATNNGGLFFKIHQEEISGTVTGAAQTFNISAVQTNWRIQNLNVLVSSDLGGDTIYAFWSPGDNATTGFQTEIHDGQHTNYGDLNIVWTGTQYTIGLSVTLRVFIWYYEV